ncbi:hypothetical protein Pfo_023993 [Paulownia fortunei]|nr:hypothetical protein Pfo_023993 [Paulownia fortunei]
MELAVANTISKLLILLFKSLYGDTQKFYSSVQFFLQTFPKLFPTKWNHLWRKMQISNTCDQPLLHQVPCSSETSEGEERICIAEMNVMMNRLGMVCGLEGINGNTSFGAEDFLSLFEEEEPSLDEIKETFGVFDVNNDGFIDASELHRVVRNLGLKERCELEECERMIKAFDGNGDGLVDFQEFVKFMEKCLW